MPVAIVTGASKGFGRALTLSLARDSWTLIIDARRSAELTDVGESVAHLGADVVAIPGDVSDPDHRATLVAAAAERGALDLLVNNASTLGPSPLPRLTDYPRDALQRVIDVNVLAPLALVQAALPLLRTSGGTVVAISSDAAVEAYAGWGGYGASKAALDHLHRVLAVEETAVRWYVVDPGDMRTEMHQAAFAGEDISDRPEPETIVPAVRSLLASGAASGRYRASDWASDRVSDWASDWTSA